MDAGPRCGSYNTNYMESVLKTTVFLKDMGDFPRMNEVYGRYFAANPSARSTVQAARLPRDVSVEIDAIASVSRWFFSSLVLWFIGSWLTSSGSEPKN